jgi:hypothetical protein
MVEKTGGPCRPSEKGPQSLSHHIRQPRPGSASAFTATPVTTL